MKFYERLNPVERKKLVLNAVAFSSAMEGMDGAKEECLKELKKLERDEVTATLSESADQKVG